MLPNHDDRPVVVIGGAGFGREVLDILLATNRPCAGVVDDSPSKETLEKIQRMGAKYLGTLDEWLRTADEVSTYVVGIAWPDVRAPIVHQVEQHGHSPVALVHPTATIAEGVRIYPGGIVCAGALLSTFVELGPHTHVNPGAVIGHDTSLGEFTTVNPRATISGGCVVERSTLIGANCTILQGLTISREAVIGAGSVITKDVPAGVVAKGVPGRWG